MRNPNTISLTMLTVPEAPLNLLKMIFDRGVIRQAEALSSNRKPIVSFSLSMMALDKDGSMHELKAEKELSISIESYGKAQFDQVITPQLDFALTNKVFTYISDVRFSDGTSWHADSRQLKSLITKSFETQANAKKKI